MAYRASPERIERVKARVRTIEERHNIGYLRRRFLAITERGFDLSNNTNRFIHRLYKSYISFRGVEFERDEILDDSIKHININRTRDEYIAVCYSKALLDAVDEYKRAFNGMIVLLNELREKSPEFVCSLEDGTLPVDTPRLADRIEEECFKAKVCDFPFSWLYFSAVGQIYLEARRRALFTAVLRSIR